MLLLQLLLLLLLLLLVVLLVVLLVAAAVVVVNARQRTSGCAPKLNCSPCLRAAAAGIPRLWRALTPGCVSLER